MTGRAGEIPRFVLAVVPERVFAAVVAGGADRIDVRRLRVLEALRFELRLGGILEVLARRPVTRFTAPRGSRRSGIDLPVVRGVDVPSVCRDTCCSRVTNMRGADCAAGGAGGGGGVDCWAAGRRGGGEWTSRLALSPPRARRRRSSPTTAAPHAQMIRPAGLILGLLRKMAAALRGFEKCTEAAQPLYNSRHRGRLGVPHPRSRGAACCRSATIPVSVSHPSVTVTVTVFAATAGARQRVRGCLSNGSIGQVAMAPCSHFACQYAPRSQPASFAGINTFGQVGAENPNRL